MTPSLATSIASGAKNLRQRPPPINRRATGGPARCGGVISYAAPSSFRRSSMRPGTRRLLSILTCLALVAALGPAAPAQERPRAGGELLVVVAAEPPSFDAHRVVEAVEAPTPDTVVFRLKWHEASFIANLSSPWNWIYKADLLAKDPNWYEKNVMGTGPFKFVEYVRGSHWVGKRNPDYWDRGKPYLDGFRAIFIPRDRKSVV